MLVDTSVWIDHFRRGNTRLASCLVRGEVHSHSFVIGELACGNLERRDEVLAWLAALPRVPVVTDDEALVFVGAHRLMGRGLGWVDVHLLASARLAGTPLWTLDLRLARATRRLGIVTA